MREEGDTVQGDRETAAMKTALMRTIEAAARRWYPSGVPRALFDRALAEAFTKSAQAAQCERSAVAGADSSSADEPPKQGEAAVTATLSEPHLRAQCVVPGPLSEEEESLLFRAVTQGLRWRWENVVVIFRDDLSQIRTGVPIVACGVPDLLASLGGSVDHDRVTDGLSRWIGGDLIETVSLADALTSREAKRQLWSHLQILLAVAKKEE